MEHEQPNVLRYRTNASSIGMFNGLSKMLLIWKTFEKDKAALISLAVLGIIALAAIFAPVLSSYSPTAGVITERLQSVGTKGHWLGTDGQGRDIFSRLLWGARMSLVVSLLPVLVAGVFSLFLGLVAGYFRGNILSETIMRCIDILFAFPMVLFAIAIAAVLGPGMINVMLAVGITLIPYMTRVVFTATVQESSKEYIEAAKAAGATTRQILFNQITPNVLSPLIVYGTTLVGLMVVLASGLSFLGIGIQPPTPDWGIMTSDGRSVLLQGEPHVTVIPGIAILIVSLAFNLVGDGLRDALDPQKQTV
jgi:ABC-type dipeptide/oligopeptide/nickel transport system permease subunit